MCPPEPCCAVFGNAKRFPTKDVEPTPGPADARPWVHRKEGETYQRIVFEETWRSAVSTQPKSYKGGAPLAHIPDLDDEQERAVMEARNQLLNEPFKEGLLYLVIGLIHVIQSSWKQVRRRKSCRNSK
jgi:hypothetical protein